MRKIWKPKNISQTKILHKLKKIFSKKHMGRSLVSRSGNPIWST